MSDFKDRIEKLNNMISQSRKIVFFGGAGVSTASGIPDFRSKDGLYNQHDVRFDKYEPEYLLSHSCLFDNPIVFYEFYRQKLDGRSVSPNIIHKTLADMEKHGKLSSIITQNIDGLHQKGGSKRVLEIHGTTQRNYCVRCKKEFDSDFIFNSTERIPRCSCGGMVRPDVTLYEESLPQKVWEESIDEIESADMLIIGGTSLMVYPASSLIRYYRGDNIVIINRDTTKYDSYANLVFHENLEDVFEKIVI